MNEREELRVKEEVSAEALEASETFCVCLQVRSFGKTLVVLRDISEPAEFGSKAYLLWRMGSLVAIALAMVD